MIKRWAFARGCRFSGEYYGSTLGWLITGFGGRVADNEHFWAFIREDSGDECLLPVGTT